MTLIEFLTDRLDDDERSLREKIRVGDPGWWGDERYWSEVEAKRRIVGLHTGHHECAGRWPDTGEPKCVLVRPGYIEHDPTLCLLALPYDTHPDYDEGWRP